MPVLPEKNQPPSCARCPRCTGPAREPRCGRTPLKGNPSGADRAGAARHQAGTGVARETSRSCAGRRYDGRSPGLEQRGPQGARLRRRARRDGSVQQRAERSSGMTCQREPSGRHRLSPVGNHTCARRTRCISRAVGQGASRPLREHRLSQRPVMHLTSCGHHGDTVVTARARTSGYPLEFSAGSTWCCERPSPSAQIGRVRNWQPTRPHRACAGRMPPAKRICPFVPRGCFWWATLRRGRAGSVIRVRVRPRTRRRAGPRPS